MNNFGKVLLNMGLLSLLSVMPLAAQIDNGVDFTASFPFYAGDVKLPAAITRWRDSMTWPIYSVEDRDDLQLGTRRFHTDRVCATSPQFRCHLQEIWGYGLSRPSLD